MSLTSVCPKLPTASSRNMPAFSLALSFFLLGSLYASAASAPSPFSMGGAMVIVILEQDGSRSARASCSHVDCSNNRQMVCTANVKRLDTYFHDDVGHPASKNCKPNQHRVRRARAKKDTTHILSCSNTSSSTSSGSSRFSMHLVVGDLASSSFLRANTSANVSLVANHTESTHSNIINGSPSPCHVMIKLVFRMSFSLAPPVEPNPLPPAPGSSSSTIQRFFPRPPV
jgi:hypothetical protein